MKFVARVAGAATSVGVMWLCPDVATGDPGSGRPNACDAGTASSHAGVPNEPARDDLPERIAHAVAERRRGLWSESTESLRRIASDASRAGHSELTAASLLELGRSEVLLGDREEAREAWSSSATRFAALGDAVHAIRARLNLLELELGSEGTSAAESGGVTAPDAFASADTSTGSHDLPAWHSRLARLGREVSSLDPADRLPLQIAVARLWLASADAIESRVGLRLAAVAAGDAVEIAQTRLDRRAQAVAWRLLAEIHLRHGRLDSAAELANRGLVVVRAIDADDLLPRLEWTAARVARAQGRNATALNHLRASVAVLDRVRLETRGFTPQSAVAFRDRVEPIYLDLVDLLLRSTEGAKPETANLLLIEARDTVERWKRAELRNHLRDPCVAEEARARPEELPGAWVLYPIALPDRLELVLAREGELWRATAPVTRKGLDTELLALRRLLPRPTRQYLRPASRVYDWVIAPIADRLATHPEDPLVVVPSGRLRDVPPAVLYDAESQRHLVEARPVAIVPGLSLVDPRAIETRRAHALAVGTTVAPEGAAPLPFVASELDALVATFPATQLRDGDFTAERLEAALGRRAYAIVHMATHGELSPDPSDSYLLTHDGRLHLSQLGSLIARTRFRDEPVELLTLSACETAVGDGRAALGFAGIAVQAGARSVVASLWRVDDEATSALMAHFYRRLAAPETSRAAALRVAQRVMIASERWRHPRYWAAFVLISNWV